MLGGAGKNFTLKGVPIKNLNETQTKCEKMAKSKICTFLNTGLLRFKVKKKKYLIKIPIP